MNSNKENKPFNHSMDGLVATIEEFRRNGGVKPSAIISFVCKETGLNKNEASQMVYETLRQGVERGVLKKKRNVYTIGADNGSDVSGQHDQSEGNNTDRRVALYRSRYRPATRRHRSPNWSMSPSRSRSPSDSQSRSRSRSGSRSRSVSRSRLLTGSRNRTPSPIHRSSRHHPGHSQGYRTRRDVLDSGRRRRQGQHRRATPSEVYNSDSSDDLSCSH